MLRRLLACLFALTLALNAVFAAAPGGGVSLPLPLPAKMGGTGNAGGALGNRFPAENFGPCAATRSLVGNDPGACVMAAYAAAVAAGAGTIVVPPGNFTGQLTAIVFSASYISLECPGSGNTLDRSSVFRAATTISADPSFTGVQFTMSPISGSRDYLYGMGLKGCLFNGNSHAAQSVLIQDVAYGDIDIACEEATVTCGQLNVTDLANPLGGGGGAGPGNQLLRVRAFFKQTLNPATGFLLSRATFSGADIIYNNSYARIETVTGDYNGGDGFVASGADNEIVGDLEVFNVGHGAGKACVIADAGYTPPNGAPTVGSAASIIIEHTGSPCLVHGYQNGFAPVAGGGNSCSGCGPAVLTPTVTANAPLGSATIFLSSTVGIGTDSVMSCTVDSTHAQEGVLDGDQVFQVFSDHVVLAQNVSAPLTAGATCRVTSGVRGNAAAGSYTVSYNGATWSLAYTGSGSGHSQSGVAMAAGVALFEDLTWQFSGTANSGDSWSFSTAIPTRAVVLDNVDTAVNNVQPGVFQYGSYGWFRASGTFYPTQIGPQGIGTQGIAFNGGFAAGPGCFSFTPFGSCYGYMSFQAGIFTSTSGYAGCVFNGNNNQYGFFGCVFGLQGSDLSADGVNGLYNVSTLGGGQFFTQGDDQTMVTHFSGKSSGGGVTVQLVADQTGTQAPLDCLNLPVGRVAKLVVELQAVDHANPGVNVYAANWGYANPHVLTYQSTPKIDGATSSVAPDGTPLKLGATSTASAAIAPVAGEICLGVSFVMPTGNSDPYDISAYVKVLVGG